MQNRDRITGAVGLTALFAAELGVGGAPRIVVVAIVVIMALAAAAQITSRRKLDGVSPLLWILGAAIVLTAIQLIPLPAGMAAWFNETGHALAADSEALAGATSSWRPISLDPPGTLVELAKFAGYFLIAWMALRAASTERGRYRLLATMALLGGMIALVAVGHELLDADSLFGVYEPEHAHPVVMAPLLNANHLACLMVLTAIVSGGLAVHERKVPAIRVLWIVIAVGGVGVALATRSRGGVIGLGVGATVTAVLIVLQRLRESRESSRREVLRIVIPAALTVLCALVLVVYLAGDKVRGDLEDTTMSELDDPRSKYMAWSSAMELVEDAPILGSGRGAFETTFTRVNPASGQLTFSHVENEYLQTVLDWGIAGAVVFAFALGYAGMFVLRRWHRGSLSAAAIGGIGAVAVQSLVDFGLELPGVAIPVVLVGATLLYVPVRETSLSVTRQAFRAAACVIAIVIGLVAGSPAGKTVQEDHTALRDGDPTVVDAKQALQRHPLDYLSAAYVASLSTVPSEQIALTNHALRLHPTHAGLHHTVARWLVSTKRFEQAAFEYRFAMLRDYKVDSLVAEIVKTMPTKEAILAFPTASRLWSRIVTMLVRANRVDIALAYMELAADEDGKRVRDFWLRMYTLGMQTEKYKSALRAARELEVLEASPSGTVRVARVQLKLGEELAAIETLSKLVAGAPSTPDHIDAHLITCSARVARKEWEPAKQCLRKTLQLANVSLANRRELHRQMAVVETGLGNERAAALERELAGDK